MAEPTKRNGLPAASASSGPREQPVPIAVTLLDAVFAFKARGAALEVVFDGGVEARLVIGVNENFCVPCSARGGYMIFAVPLEHFHLRRKE